MYTWKKVKEAGNRLFAPEKGGSYNIFETRPLDPRILAYCAQDVAARIDVSTRGCNEERNSRTKRDLGAKDFTWLR